MKIYFKGRIDECYENHEWEFISYHNDWDYDKPVLKIKQNEIYFMAVINSSLTQKSIFNYN